MLDYRKRRLLAILWLPLSLLAWLYGYHLNQETIGLLQSGTKNPNSAHASVEMAGEEGDVVMGDQPDNIFHIVQVTDLHVSRYHTVGGIAHLMHFLQTTLPLISPSIVVATGDLTDAKTEHVKAGVQFEDEWQTYRRLLKDSGALDKANGHFWYDLRGNHDCFSVPSWDHASNYYRQYGASPNRTGWAFELEKPFGRYAFIAADGCPHMGPTRLYNFFGYLDTEEMDLLAARVDAARDANHTIMLSHYPVTTMLFGTTSDGRRFEDLSRSISAYLCGHLHRLAGGLGDMLQGYKPTGFMELELPDLKLTASYRVLAIDHDMISIADRFLELPEIPYPITSTELPEQQPASPVVLITNPKDARYAMPLHEPLGRIKRSTHIRALVFAQTEVKQVQVWIDGENKGNMQYSGRGSRDDAPGQFIPLWTMPWSAADYDDGRAHEILISVVDAEGRQGQDMAIFRVDGQREELDAGWSGIIIHSNFEHFFKYWFMSLYVIICAVLLLPKLHLAYLEFRNRSHGWHVRSIVAMQQTRQRLIRPEASTLERLVMLARLQLQLWRHRFYVLADQDIIWMPLYVHFLWIICLPLYPGRLFLNDDVGLSWVYLYGIWVDNNWVPVLDTWAMPTVMLGLLEIWVLVYLFVAVTDADHKITFSEITPRRRPFSRNIVVRLCIAWCLFIQCCWHWATWRTARWASVLGGFCTVWWVITQLVLVWYYGFAVDTYAARRSEGISSPSRQPLLNGGEASSQDYGSDRSQVNDHTD